LEQQSILCNVHLARRRRQSGSTPLHAPDLVDIILDQLGVVELHVPAKENVALSKDKYEFPS
jgi:hypothetical protein